MGFSSLSSTSTKCENWSLTSGLISIIALIISAMSSRQRLGKIPVMPWRRACTRWFPKRPTSDFTAGKTSEILSFLAAITRQKYSIH